MLSIIETIAPIFMVIMVGWGLSHKKILTQEVSGPLNKIVFYLAIPVMIFEKVAHADFSANFSTTLVVGVLLAAASGFFLAVLVVSIFPVYPRHKGTFAQASFHGNIGYIGLAVAYYFLGDLGLTRASILSAFILILQNFLSVAGLQYFSNNEQTRGKFSVFLKNVAGNPVIISAVAGSAVSLAGIPIPEIISRFLHIISGMALPLALLDIGGSLSFPVIKAHWAPTLATGFIKLLFLPAAGWFLFTMMGVPHDLQLVGIILLGAPTATVTYVMAREMGGATALASSAISLNTLASALTYVLWLGIIVQ
ncbi:AEC family transporter [Desulfatibacillum aliphaticivorans]|uniref:AEC family transporter n=1 Tax=Desulfatibacillum aliphaticivorans TaxID=218208 RepID=UPI00041C12B2|nr:AEC family transporter [Desulfatibacillum aliphaticivorans]